MEFGEEHYFSELDHVKENWQLSNILKNSDLSEWAHRHLRKFVALLVDICLHIFAYLYHKHSVISLGSKSCMSNRKIITKLVDREIALSTASLSAY